MTREEALRLADEQLKGAMNFHDGAHYDIALAWLPTIGLPADGLLRAAIRARERLADKIMEEGNGA